MAVAPSTDWAAGRTDFGPEKVDEKVRQRRRRGYKVTARGWRSIERLRLLSAPGPIAQRLEQGTHNPLVPGSNPGGPISLPIFPLPIANLFRLTGRWLRVLLEIALFSGLILATRCANYEDVFVGGQIYFVDPDCYSRMTRVRMVAEHPGLIVRQHDFENFPAGISPHTTAPLDYLIALLAAVLRPFTGAIARPGRGDRFAATRARGGMVPLVVVAPDGVAGSLCPAPALRAERDPGARDNARPAGPAIAPHRDRAGGAGGGVSAAGETVARVGDCERGQLGSGACGFRFTSRSSCLSRCCFCSRSRRVRNSQPRPAGPAGGFLLGLVLVAGLVERRLPEWPGSGPFFANWAATIGELRPVGLTNPDLALLGEWFASR